MKFLCTLKNALLIIRDRFGMSFATKSIGLPCCTLFTVTVTCPLQIILLSNYLLPTILVLAENTLLKTTCHFLLLLIRFDALTYQKDYDWFPIPVGYQRAREGERSLCAPLYSNLKGFVGTQNPTKLRGKYKEMYTGLKNIEVPCMIILMLSRNRFFTGN